jgi:hypothetical protein
VADTIKAARASREVEGWRAATDRKVRVSKSWILLRKLNKLTYLHLIILVAILGSGG